ncbi:MAG: type III pantothenate kinase, partial [Bacteroidetes bacterium]|nr:type III pantothenate kinase [Bacteroidota bacterium]
AIDIGNTHTVIGIYNGSKLLGDWRVTSYVTRTEDEFGALVKQFCEGAKVPLKKITSIGIASVVPNLTDVCVKMSQKYFALEPIVVSSDLDLGMKVMYDDPRAVGADRLCNAVAGFAKYKGPIVIVDFGTATTFDVVSKNGEYLGGVITAGIETTAGELHRRAAKLPKIDLKFPERVIGKNTVESMQAGILYGALDSMETMIRRISKELDDYPIVIATGGFSETMKKQSKVINKHEPALVLEGIRLIVDRVEKKKKKK